MNDLLKKNGFLVRKFNNNKLLNIVKKIIKKHFDKKLDYYLSLPKEKFYNLALECQNSLNEANLQKIFDDNEKKFLKKLFKNEDYLYSSIITLRVVRPKENSKQGEQIGWHRETFYGNNKYIKDAINLWIPVMNVQKDNALGIIPKSHLVDDKKIIRRKYKYKDYNVKKFSAAHKLGFPYAPKKIVSGLNLDNAKRIYVKSNYFMVFSQMLVHGNAENQSKKIRFAINLGLIDKKKLIRNRVINKNKFILKNKKNQLYIELN